MGRPRIRRKKPRQERPVSSPVGFGVQAEWEAFLKENPERIRAIEGILDTCEAVFIGRSLSSDKPSDRIGFYLGRICVEDFNEVLLLAGNGYGVGALKILRGMYERAVTSAYILANPDSAEQFLDYDNVHAFRAYNHAMKLGEFAPRVSSEDAARIKAGYEAVRAQYTETLCDTCSKTRIQSSWTKLDTASMAQKAGKGYADLYFDAFYLPTLQVHTTVSSLKARIILKPGGGMTFKDGSQRAEARRAVVMAHNLLLRVLDSQNTHFKLGLEVTLEKNVADFQRAYSKDPPKD